MRTSPAASKKEFRWGTIIIILIFLLGILITFYTVGHIQKEMKNDLLQKAKIAAGSINQERLKKLTGTTADLNDPDYLRIKEQLKQIREAQTNCKFLYLIGRKKNGEVFFYVDSQSPESNDYAPPGLIYEEVPDKYLSVFTSMKGTTVGPVEDRWGKLMTALIPVKKPESDEEDKLFEDRGIKLIIDMRSFLYLAGTRLDYSDGLTGQGFHFYNPNAARTCSCGESFSL